MRASALNVRFVVSMLFSWPRDILSMYLNYGKGTSFPSGGATMMAIEELPLNARIRLNSNLSKRGGVHPNTLSQDHTALTRGWECIGARNCLGFARACSSEHFGEQNVL